MQVAVNTRSTLAQLTGVQRYSKEILARLNNIDTIYPLLSKHGVSGHLWEQLVLPIRLGSSLLWSPSNTGPLYVRRQVLTIHDMATFDHPEWAGKSFGSWYRFLTPILATRVQHIIAVSHFTKQRIVSHCNISPEKVSVVHNGVNSAFKPMGLSNINQLKIELKLPCSRYILALGSIEPRKNIKNLLRAWCEIQHLIPSDIWLVIAGGEGSKRVFGNLSSYEISSRVHFTGHVADEQLPSLYSGAICSVYVSLYEGFGLPVLESMASGTPTLTSSTTSLPEVGGDAVLAINPQSVKEIGIGLKTLVDNKELREQLRFRGIERSKLFTWDLTASATQNILTREAIRV